MVGMRRREFVTLLAGAAAAPSMLWPRAVRAQQPVPVIGFLHPTSPDAFPDRLRAFRQGLKQSGYVEGENVTIAYRFAENQIDRLPAMAGELVTSRVAVITAANSPPALAAKIRSPPGDGRRASGAAGRRDRRQWARGAAGKGGDGENSNRIHGGI